MDATLFGIYNEMKVARDGNDIEKAKELFKRFCEYMEKPHFSGELWDIDVVKNAVKNIEEEIKNKK